LGCDCLERLGLSNRVQHFPEWGWTQRPIFSISVCHHPAFEPEVSGVFYMDMIYEIRQRQLSGDLNKLARAQSFNDRFRINYNQVCLTAGCQSRCSAFELWLANTNAEVLPGVTVKEVNRRYVLLSEGGAIKRVELPEDAKAQMKAGISTNATGAGSPPANHPSLSYSSRPLSKSSRPFGNYSTPSHP
jgi:hypothetical protein